MLIFFWTLNPLFRFKVFLILCFKYTPLNKIHVHIEKLTNLLHIPMLSNDLIKDILKNVHFLKYHIKVLHNILWGFRTFKQYPIIIKVNNNCLIKHHTNGGNNSTW